LETHEDTKRNQSVRFFGARLAEEIEQVISCSEGQLRRRPRNTYQRGSRVSVEAAQCLGRLTQRQQGLAQKLRRPAQSTQRAKGADAESIEAVAEGFRGYAEVIQ